MIMLPIQYGEKCSCMFSVLMLGCAQHLFKPKHNIVLVAVNDSNSRHMEVQILVQLREGILYIEINFFSKQGWISIFCLS